MTRKSINESLNRPGSRQLSCYAKNVYRKGREGRKKLKKKGSAAAADRKK